MSDITKDAPLLNGVTKPEGSKLMGTDGIIRAKAEPVQPEPEPEGEKQSTLESLFEEKPVIEPAEKPKSKESTAYGMAKSFAEKLLKEEITAEDIPEWLRNRAIRIAEKTKEEVIEEDNQLVEIEKKFTEEIKTVKQTLNTQIEEKENTQSINFIKEFNSLNNLSDNEFMKYHGSEFRKIRNEFIDYGMPKSKATKQALLNLTTQELIETGKYSMPSVSRSSGIDKDFELRKEFEKANAELAKVGLAPTTWEAFKKVNSY